jgi:hypothetical protein
MRKTVNKEVKELLDDMISRTDRLIRELQEFVSFRRPIPYEVEELMHTKILIQLYDNVTMLKYFCAELPEGAVTAKK